LRLGFTGVVIGLFAAITPFQGCKSGVGATCRCATDCKNGLICQATGRPALNPGACAGDGVGNCCYPIETAGQCVESTLEADSDGAGSGLEDDPTMNPMTKHDLFPDTTGTESGSSGTGSTDSATTDTSTNPTTVEPTTVEPTTDPTVMTSTTGMTGTTSMTGTGTSTGGATSTTGSTGATSTTGGTTDGTTGTTGTT
jgi:hypothetical protein